MSKDLLNNHPAPSTELPKLGLPSTMYKGPKPNLIPNKEAHSSHTTTNHYVRYAIYRIIKINTIEI